MVLLQFPVDEEPDPGGRRLPGAVVAVVVGAVHRPVTEQDDPGTLSPVFRARGQLE